MNRDVGELNESVGVDDLRHLTAAEGYIELGMLEEADVELEKVDADCSAFSHVLALKLCIYAGLAEWKLMAAVARKLTQHDPSDVQWVIWWAYAAGKGQSVERAKAILIRALRAHPNDPRIHYALCCYENRLQHFNTARRHLARAIQLDFRLRLLGLEDQQLEPLWWEFEQFE